MDALRQTLIEKVARDAGFDRVPRRHGEWLICGSSHFGETVHLRLADASDGIKVALAERPRYVDIGALAGVARAEGLRDPASGGVREAWVAQDDDEALGELLRVVAREATQRRDQPLDRFRRKVAKLPQSTEAERLVVVRVGQDIFRDALIEYWDGACAVLGLEITSLLRASHAKPWARCESDAERLDVHNGLLLSPHLDAAFDGGWITFEADARMKLSEQLPPAARATLGLRYGMKLRKIVPAHQPYLAYHRDHVFRP